MPSIKTDSGEMYYRVKGSGSTTVALLHDYFATHQSWNAQILQLSRYFLVLAPDLRGHGRSVLDQGNMSISDMASDVVEMLNDANIDRAHVIGCSHGAVVALHLARTERERIDSIVVTSVPDLAAPETIEYGRWYTSTVFPRMEPELVKTHGDGNPQYAREVLLVNFVASLDSPPDDHLNAIAKASEIGIPALVLGGDRDPVMPADRALKLAGEIQNAELGVLPSTGHLAHQEAPTLYTDTVLDFIWRRQESDSATNR